MRILLTGVTGQIGAALAARLDEHELILADRQTLDLARPDMIHDLLDRLVPNLIINPAAYTAVDNAEIDQKLAMSVNRDAPSALAAWAARRAVPLIHFSTDYVFDGSGQRPWREEDATNPLSFYGYSKAAGEQAVRAAGGHSLILRTSWVYASRGANFVRTITRLARERKELRVVADQFGAPTPASAIADAVCEMLSKGLEPFRSRSMQAQGIIHFAAAGETTWHELAVTILEMLRERGIHFVVEQVHAITSDEYATRAKRPRNSRLDTSRCRDIFEISAAHWRLSLQRELDMLVKDFVT